MSSTVGRYAPSPSGRMHLGNLCCCLLAWLSAKSSGGKVVLRIEDLDTLRCSAENAEILKDEAYMRKVLARGADIARAQASETLREVRHIMGIRKI